MADLAYTTATWRGLALGRGGPYLFKPGGLLGWLSLPPARKVTAPRSGGHGNAKTGVWMGGRTVTMAGFVEATANRDSVVRTFRGTMIPNRDPYDTEELQISMAGLTTSAFGQLVAADIEPAEMWGSGGFTWKAQWEFDDPFRYGPERTANAQLAGAGVIGLTLPDTLPDAFPAKSVGVGFVVNNPGHAPAKAVYTLTGQWTNPGILLTATGQPQRQVTWPVALALGEYLTVDTDDGNAYLVGSPRAPKAGSDLIGDLALQPGDNTIQYLGDPGSTGASITAVFRDTYW
jgi:hypothetical protein